MFKKSFKYRVLKDGKPVYEQISYPLFVQFLLSELKPAHGWTIEEIEPAVKSLEPISIDIVQCECCGEEIEIVLTEEDLANYGLVRR